MTNKSDNIPDMLPEYDFDYSKGVRNPYFDRLMKEGSNVVVLEPDVADAFPNSQSVNTTLRAALVFARATQQAAPQQGDKAS